ncbi:chromosome segregation protein SMC [Schaalia naturae]|uniref:Chromosome partition protein Smc n=3 Tax=Schaalia naturae TaxID=635203 RepID=A0ABW2SL64_9ACTO
MHLKTLTLRGFKSFASSTTLRLEPGITCVVGPNGSGKSNVVDALAWVMGEQGAKTLRGGQMADVIFAGTSARAPLGRAQVELTIDNADGTLPIEYSEVTISRTLFRGGGSEYSINGASARLLDVQELLSDTGMGRQMHVIVGQNQLDTILSATPEERRGFIEEAAGVLKHRRRKDRALHKLADMDQNLVRVLDLTNEIHRQLRPLARQAEAARKASAIQTRVRDARARLLADDVVSLRTRLDEQQASDRAAQARRERLEGRLREERAALERLEDQERAAGPEVERAAAVWRELTTLHERLRGTAMLAAERVEALSRPAGAPQGEDPEELERRAEEAGTEDADLLRRVEQGRTELERASRARADAEERDERASRELARVNRLLADRREKVARLTGDVAASRSRLEASRSEAERARGLVEAAEKRRREAEERAAQAPSPPPAEGDTGASAHERAVRLRDRARARVDALLTEEREARAERARWESRRDTLAESLTPDDATADLAGRPGIVADLPSLLSVEEGWEDALAALLSPLADAAVAEDLGSAVDQVRSTRSEGGGRVRMILSRAQPGSGSGDGGRAGLPEAGRWALDVVRVDERVGPAMAAALDGCVVCEDLDQVAGLVALPGVRAVATLGGDVVTATSVVGSGRGGSSVLTLHAQYEHAVGRAADAEQRESQAAAALVTANGEYDAAVKAANEALRALREEDAGRARLAEEAARASSASAAAAAEADRSRAALARVEEQVAWAQEQVEAARQRLEQAEGLEPAEDLAASQRAAEEASSAARRAREEETAQRLSLRTDEERSRQAQGRARSLRQAAARSREERERHARAERLRLARLDSVGRIAQGAEIAVEAAARALARAEEAHRHAEEARADSSQALSERRRRIDELTRELGEVTGASHRDEVARAEMTARMENLERSSVGDLGLEADQLVEEYGPHNLVPDPDGGAAPYVRSEQEQELQRATRELERLGRVNPLALEEHAALSQRHEFLVSQVQDLKKSKADLLRIIDDVDALVREAFSRAFSDIQEQFVHTFEVLFPGGEGRLVLTDPEDMLATGIEIEARPAGKKVRRLSLLSGGERSLAALAFLVAIFRARPSPFYVMDEVEAALDDVNLSRLLRIFEELRRTSQLIVITHQKRTMELADALYGVTMRDGVTSVVSQRLAS